MIPALTLLMLAAVSGVVVHPAIAVAIALTYAAYLVVPPGRPTPAGWRVFALSLATALVFVVRLLN